MSAAAPTPTEEDQKIADEIAERIKIKASEICPMCKTTKWWLVDLKDVSTNILLTSFYSVPTYTFICKRCGYVRQHLRSVIDGTVADQSGL